MTEDNKEKTLKLKYEHFRTYTFAFFTISVAIAFGGISNLKLILETKYGLLSLIILCFTFLISTIGMMIFNHIMVENYSNLLEFYGEIKKERKNYTAQFILFVILILEIIRLFQIIF